MMPKNSMMAIFTSSAMMPEALLSAGTIPHLCTTESVPIPCNVLSRIVPTNFAMT
ncbi:hypothetical protein D3C76_1775080 [compost metagenome]